MTKVQNLLEWVVQLSSHVAVVAGGMVLCPVVGKVGVVRSQEETELVLVDTVATEPVEMHVHGFGLFGLDTTIDDALSSAVVCLDWSRGLMMTQFL